MGEKLVSLESSNLIDAKFLRASDRMLVNDPSTNNSLFTKYKLDTLPPAIGRIPKSLEMG